MNAHSVFFASDGRLRSGWRFAIGLSLSFVALILAGLFAYSFFPSIGRGFEGINRSLSLALLLILYYILGRSLDRQPQPLVAMGLGLKQPVLLQIIVGIILGAAMISGALLWIGAAGRLTIVWKWNATSLQPFLVTLLILATAAMGEEVVFRGYPFQRLLEAAGGPLTIAITSALFGLAHWSNPHASLIAVFNTVLVGVLFSIAYLRTRSLWFCWAIHFSWNTVLGLVFGLPVSGTTQFAVLGTGSAEGPTWLTGGSYGIEAGLSGTAVVLAGIVAVLLLTHRPWLSNSQHAELPEAPPAPLLP